MSSVHTASDSRMTKSEARILKSIANGGAHWGSYSLTFGQRERNAAQQLAEAGLAKIVDMHQVGDSTTYEYKVIEPHREWDYTNRRVKVLA